MKKIIALVAVLLFFAGSAMAQHHRMHHHRMHHRMHHGHMHHHRMHHAR